VPDRFGFDHLGSNMRCIWCADGRSCREWPDERLARRARRWQAESEADW